MAVGDKITVCDGTGMEYDCSLSYIRDEECLATVEGSVESSREPERKITLYMAYPKGDKLETVIQKAVELGAWRIIPFESSRCIKRPKAEKADKQTARLQRIAEEAAKQCGRAIIPTVSQPKSFKEMLSEVKDNALTLLCYENEDGRTIKDLLKAEPCPASIGVIVGSEGGFSPEEVVEMTEVGCVSVSLGERILRCETAPSYALSAISYEYEL
jgi:16S rRNA (uracil1498-N3)-methyltransferase